MLGNAQHMSECAEPSLKNEAFTDLKVFNIAELQQYATAECHVQFHPQINCFYVEFPGSNTRLSACAEISPFLCAADMRK